VGKNPAGNVVKGRHDRREIPRNQKRVARVGGEKKTGDKKAKVTAELPREELEQSYTMDGEAKKTSSLIEKKGKRRGVSTGHNSGVQAQKKRKPAQKRGGVPADQKGQGKAIKTKPWGTIGAPHHGDTPGMNAKRLQKHNCKKSVGERGGSRTQPAGDPKGACQKKTR